MTKDSLLWGLLSTFCLRTVSGGKIAESQADDRRSRCGAKLLLALHRLGQLSLPQFLQPLQRLGKVTSLLSHLQPQARISSQQGLQIGGLKLFQPNGQAIAEVALKVAQDLSSGH